MRIACIGYRKWALSIYEKLQREFSDYMFLMQLCKDDFSEIQINKFKPNFILFYGWSDIISDKIIINKQKKKSIIDQLLGYKFPLIYMV